MSFSLSVLACLFRSTLMTFATMDAHIFHLSSCAFLKSYKCENSTKFFYTKNHWKLLVRKRVPKILSNPWRSIPKNLNEILKKITAKGLIFKNTLGFPKQLMTMTTNAKNVIL